MSKNSNDQSIISQADATVSNNTSYDDKRTKSKAAAGKAATARADSEKSSKSKAAAGKAATVRADSEKSTKSKAAAGKAAAARADSEKSTKSKAAAGKAAAARADSEKSTKSKTAAGKAATARASAGKRAAKAKASAAKAGADLVESERESLKSHIISEITDSYAELAALNHCRSGIEESAVFEYEDEHYKGAAKTKKGRQIIKNLVEERLDYFSHSLAFAAMKSEMQEALIEIIDATGLEFMHFADEETLEELARLADAKEFHQMFVKLKDMLAAQPNQEDSSVVMLQMIVDINSNEFLVADMILNQGNDFEDPDGSGISNGTFTSLDDECIFDEPEDTVDLPDLDSMSPSELAFWAGEKLIYAGISVIAFNSLAGVVESDIEECAEELMSSGLTREQALAIARSELQPIFKEALRRPEITSEIKRVVDMVLNSTQTKQFIESVNDAGARSLANVVTSSESFKSFKLIVSKMSDDELICFPGLHDNVSDDCLEAVMFFNDVMQSDFDFYGFDFGIPVQSAGSLPSSGGRRKASGRSSSARRSSAASTKSTPGKKAARSSKK